MALPTGMKLGSLGGPQTFGGEAAQLVLQKYPEFVEIVYFRTSEAGEEAVDKGEIDATCGPEQQSLTGFHARMQVRVGRPTARRWVVAEVTHGYHCSLLGLPGTPLEKIRKVIGHTGSITQSRHWIEKHLPRATIEIIDSNSLGAARDVLAGDGTLASVGTPAAAQATGLEQLATEIDGGSVGSYWAIAGRPLYSDNPTRLVVAGRFGANSVMSDVVGCLSDVGYRVQTISATPTGQALYEYDYLLRLAGSGSLTSVQGVMERFPQARLVGAFDAR